MHGCDIYSGKVKYDFSVNVNPEKISLKATLSFFMSYASLKNYPDLESAELCSAISDKYDIPKENIIVGNGASEIILAAVRAVRPHKALLLSPCFSGYIHALDSQQTKKIYFPLRADEDFSLTSERVLELKELIKTERPEMFFICNPNNPNGKLYSRDLITELCDHCKRLGTFVLLDECFMELSGRREDFSLCNTFPFYDNLIIVNALTKTYAVPGLRLGFGFCSSKEILSAIKKQLPEWNVSIPAQKMGKSLIQDNKKRHEAVKKIEKEKSYLSKGLSSLGFKVYPTDANFILFYAENEDKLKEKLLLKQILIRDCSDYESLGPGFYRVAVKTHRQNEILVETIKHLWRR